MIDMAKEVERRITKRSYSLLTALDLCIEQLERQSSGDRAIQYALECAREAAQQERHCQARVGVS